MAHASRIDTPPVPEVLLELTGQEAADLYLLLNYLGGSPKGTVRETLTDGISRVGSVHAALGNLGIVPSDKSRLTGLSLQP